MVCAGRSRKSAHSSVHRGYLVVIEAINLWKAFFSLSFLLLMCNTPRKGAQCVGRYLLAPSDLLQYLHKLEAS